MDRLHLMDVFIAVVDTGGFAGAARKLGLSAPAVTRAIHELESHLGVRLLTRTTRVVRVTDAGARYVEDCRRIVADVAEADESVAGLHATPRGRLTITAPALFGTAFVTPIVTDYLARYPEVQASCWFLDRVVNMMDEGVDVGIRIGDLPDSTLQAIQVGRVRRVIVAAPSYIEQHGLAQTPQELAEHTVISANSVTPAPEWRLMANGEPCTVKITPRMATTTNDSAVAAALSGFGLTRLMSYQVAEHLRTGRLKTVLTDFEPPPLPIHVVHREGRHASQKARAFIDLAVASLRSNTALN